ncbi:MAG: SRPBCC family protein [Bdellovibrionia bacterium]
MIYPAKQISVSIQRSVTDVYEFASDPENLPKWAAGLSRSTITRSGDEWIADSPMGQVRVKFAPSNPFGVMDHDVTLPSGDVNHNPFRVVKNGEGSEVIFTLYRLPSMSDSSFDQDAKLIETDLLKLQSILQKGD